MNPGPMIGKLMEHNPRLNLAHATASAEVQERVHDRLLERQMELEATGLLHIAGE